jgi:hypothetical protein
MNQFNQDYPQDNRRRIYIRPDVEIIRLDNEISLQLQSEPPTFETRNMHESPEYFNNSPFMET